MTKDGLINAVVKSCSSDNLSKQLTGEVLDTTFENIHKAIKNSKCFTYPGFGTFTVRNRKARKGRNPLTGTEIQIRASKALGFKVAPKPKESL